MICNSAHRLDVDLVASSSPDCGLGFLGTESGAELDALLLEQSEVAADCSILVCLQTLDSPFKNVQRCPADMKRAFRLVVNGHKVSARDGTG